MTVGAFAGKLFFDDILSGDAGMISPRHPQNVIPAQSTVAAHDILHGIIQGVTHMKNTRYIRRRNDNRISGL